MFGRLMCWWKGHKRRVEELEAALRDFTRLDDSAERLVDIMVGNYADMPHHKLVAHALKLNNIIYRLDLEMKALTARLAAYEEALKWMAKHGTPAAKVIADEALAQEGR